MAAAIKLAQIEFHHPFCVCLAYGSETCGCVTNFDTCSSRDEVDLVDEIQFMLISHHISIRSIPCRFYLWDFYFFLCLCISVMYGPCVLWVLW